MLGKVMKYEWRSTWKVNTLLLGLLAGAMLLVGFFLMMPLDHFDEDIVLFLVMTMVLLFYAALLCCGTGIPLYLTIRYYKSMYSNEGYLTHTLPLTVNQLYLGKLILFMIWNVMVQIVSSVSIGWCILAIVYQGTDGEFRLMDFLAEVIRSYDVWSQYPMMTGWQLFLVIFAVYMLVSIVSVAVQCTGVINVGQLWKSHRVAGSILVYAALYIIKQILAFAGLFNVGSISNYGISIFELCNVILIWLILGEIVIDVILFVASEGILKKKVNLE